MICWCLVLDGKQEYYDIVVLNNPAGRKTVYPVALL